jgi:hypothetical protein
MNVVYIGCVVVIVFDVATVMTFRIDRIVVRYYQRIAVRTRYDVENPGMDSDKVVGGVYL